MILATCQHETTKPVGKDRKGNQRIRCTLCGRYMVESGPKPLGDMRISMKDASLALGMLLEGMSIRSVERLRRGSHYLMRVRMWRRQNWPPPKFHHGATENAEKKLPLALGFQPGGDLSARHAVLSTPDAARARPRWRRGLQRATRYQ